MKEKIKALIQKYKNENLDLLLKRPELQRTQCIAYSEGGIYHLNQTFISELESILGCWDNWEERIRGVIPSEIIANYYKRDDFQHVLLMTSNGVGVARVYQYSDDQESVILDMLHISKESRGHGLGKRLIEIQENIGKALGVKSLYIQVERGSWMEGWYERIGYKFDKVNEEDKKWVWMKKDVKP